MIQRGVSFGKFEWIHVHYSYQWWPLFDFDKITKIGLSEFWKTTLQLRMDGSSFKEQSKGKISILRNGDKVCMHLNQVLSTAFRCNHVTNSRSYAIA